MGERTKGRCGWCGFRFCLTSTGRLRPHGGYDRDHKHIIDRCAGSMSLPREASADVLESRPTILTFHGETGEVECLPFDDLYPVRKAALDTTPCHFDWYDAMRGGPCSCPAPTPEAP